VKIGMHYLGCGKCKFTVWAPFQKEVALKIVSPQEKIIPMEKDSKGYWKITIGDTSEISALELASELIHNKEDGKIRLYLIYKSLNYRKTHRELFQNGDYSPISATGEKAVLFARLRGNLEIPWRWLLPPDFLQGLPSSLNDCPLAKRCGKIRLLSSRMRKQV